jgi:hypothetical protein
LVRGKWRRGKVRQYFILCMFDSIFYRVAERMRAKFVLSQLFAFPQFRGIWTGGNLFIIKLSKWPLIQFNIPLLFLLKSTLVFCLFTCKMWLSYDSECTLLLFGCCSSSFLVSCSFILL